MHLVPHRRHDQEDGLDGGLEKLMGREGRAHSALRFAQGGPRDGGTHSEEDCWEAATTRGQQRSEVAGVTTAADAQRRTMSVLKSWPA